MDERSLRQAALWILTGCASLWWRLPEAVHVLIYVMAADVLTGMIRAAYAGQLNSNCSFRGMMKKSAMLLVSGMGVLVDAEHGGPPYLCSALAVAFTATEFTSVIENLVAMDINLPDYIRRWFENDRKNPRKPRPTKKGDKDDGQAHS